MNDNWEDHTRTYYLNKARVVAILDEGGGAIVETVPVLEIDEGRVHTVGTDGRGQSMTSLDYAMMFHPKAERTGDRQTGHRASIVIQGTTDDGRLMEIRGDGFIGQDELGQLDGSFHELPTIYVPSDQDLREHVERQDDEWSVIPQGEFVLATYGHAQDWS